MSWLGKWRNQYGSILDITDESHHKIVATFRTALRQYFRWPGHSYDWRTPR
jgi:hypothetical protein